MCGLVNHGQCVYYTLCNVVVECRGVRVEVKEEL